MVSDGVEIAGDCPQISGTSAAAGLIGVFLHEIMIQRETEKIFSAIAEPAEPGPRRSGASVAGLHGRAGREPRFRASTSFLDEPGVIPTSRSSR